MEQMTVRDVAKAAGGRLLCGDENLEIRHLSIDSRHMKGQDLFIPLVGERVDAHRFVEQAFAAGAAAALTSEHDERKDSHPWIRVEDTKRALQAIGSYYRSRLSLPLVGITGSVGKTTTREMTAAALSAGYRVYKTPGNSNSQVGVPLALSEISMQDQIGVLELGMSLPGEMTVIARIARVDMAVITNIGIAHIEQLGSQENICREKMAIQDGMKQGSVLLLNGDDPILKQKRARAGIETIYYGTGENSAYRAENIRLENGYPVFQAACGKRRIPVRLGVMGVHNVLNAMAALAAADGNGVDLEAAAAAMEKFSGFEGRQQIYEKNGITIIDDTYNASPVSMKAGIQVLESMKAERRIAVLADMKELGPQSPGLHREIGHFLAEHPVDLLFTFGQMASQIQEGAAEKGAGFPCVSFEGPDRQALIQALLEQVRPGDCVLLKGSNSMRLSQVAACLSGKEVAEH